MRRRGVLGIFMREGGGGVLGILMMGMGAVIYFLYNKFLA
jgi:hypothetical protein